MRKYVVPLVLLCLIPLAFMGSSRVSNVSAQDATGQVLGRGTLRIRRAPIGRKSAPSPPLTVLTRRME